MFICEKCVSAKSKMHIECASEFSYKCDVCNEKVKSFWIKPEPNYFNHENLNQTKPMEKTLKMSVETARELWKEVKDAFIEHSVDLKERSYDKTNEIKGVAIKKLLLENFTKEELEGKKGFTWEESFSGEGFCLRIDSAIINFKKCVPDTENKNVFKTEKQALSALAFAQLTHIVAKYNSVSVLPESELDINLTLYKIEAYNNSDLKVEKWKPYSCVLPLNVFWFNSEKDAETSLEVNRTLWEQYYMLLCQRK